MPQVVRSNTPWEIQTDTLSKPTLAPKMAKETIDGREDIYALGCVAYFLLAGAPVFVEKTATATALAHVQKDPLPPSQRSEIQIAAPLEQIILRCLAKKPEDRPQTAQELGRLLAACGVPEWTQENACEWWQTYLPDSSAHRIARQAREAEPVTQQEE